jgi:hypothetical protein
MTRNLKILGLASLVVLALGSLIVSATQATDETPELTAGKGTSAAAQKIGLTGSGANDEFDAFGVSTKCLESTYGGENISAPTSSLTVKGIYKKCTATFGVPVTVVTNKCGYMFKLGATMKGSGGEPIPDTYTGTLDVECEKPTESIEFRVWGKVADHTENKPPACIVKVTPQTGLKGAVVTVVTAETHRIKVEGEITGIHAHQVRNVESCPAGTTTTEAKYTFPAAGIELEVVTFPGLEEIDGWID